MIHPLNDRLKVKVDKEDYDLGMPPKPTETGIVVEVPKGLLYLSFHSFAFEDSLNNKQSLEETRKFYANLEGKRIYWESLQDRGRRMEEGDEEFIYLQMTDVLAYADDVNEDARIVNQIGSSGSFNLE